MILLTKSPPDPGSCCFPQRMNPREKIKAQSAGQGKDQKCNGIDEAGLFSAPSKKVHAAGENILKDRQHGGQRGKRS